MAANPMISQYVDPVINAYPSHDRQLQPGFKAGEKMKSSDSVSKILAESRHRYELRVFNVPCEMSEDGLRNCFGKYGKIIDFFLSKSSKVQAFQWAKISYATQEEAESAIEHLHQTPPHNFDVNFYKSNEERAREKMEEIAKLEQGAAINQKQDDFYRGKIHDIPPNLVSEKQRKLDEKAKAAAFPKVQHGIKGLPFNHYFKGEVDDSSGSDDWTHVQGYIPVVVPRNHICLSDGDRQPFVFGYPKIVPNEAPIGKCSFCHEQQGRYRCSRCKEWYCSQKCQLDDWPQHKSVCRAPPVLEKCDGSVFIPPSRRLRQPNKTHEENGDVQESPKRTAAEEYLQHQIYAISERSDESKSVSLQSLSGGDPKDRLLKALDVEIEAKPEKSPKPVQPAEPAKSQEIPEPKAVKPAEPQKPQEIPEPKPVKPAEPSKSEKPVKLPEPSKPAEIGSILKSMKVNNKTEIMSDLDSGSVSSFFGTITQEPNPTLDFLIGKFEEALEGATPLKSVEIGQFIAVKDEGMTQRCLVIDKHTKNIEVVDIDSYRPGQRINLETGSVYALPVQAYEFPALAVVCLAPGQIKDALGKIIKAEFSEGQLEARIHKIHEIPRRQTRIIEAILLSKNGKDLVHYVVKPWTCLDHRIADALKAPKDDFVLEDFKNEKLVEGDEVIFTCCGPAKSNTMVVMNQKDAEFEESIMNVMTYQGPNQRQLEKLNLNQIVTCQWSEDDGYYRALVKEIKADEKKVKVRFIDYGNVSLEPIANIRELPVAALSFPVLGKLVTLKDVPAFKYTEICVKNKLKQLEPLLEGTMKITQVTNEGFMTLTHLNGKTINSIFAEKLAEPVGSTAIPPEIQAADTDGQFKYDKAHIASLISDKPDLKQDVTVLHAESPCAIFVCPNDQIGLADGITKQVSNYAGIDEKLVGFSPRVGEICLAKSQDDDSWYRAVCKRYNEQNYEMFFVDFGFVEVLPRQRLKIIDPMLLKTVFLANHCVLDGFDDDDKAEEFGKIHGAKVAELLPFMHQTKVKVVAAKNGYFVVKFGELKDMKPETEKEKQIRELQEQLAKLTASG